MASISSTSQSSQLSHHPTLLTSCASALVPLLLETKDHCCSHPGGLSTGQRVPRIPSSPSEHNTVVALTAFLADSGKQGGRNRQDAKIAITCSTAVGSSGKSINSRRYQGVLTQKRGLQVDSGKKTLGIQFWAMMMLLRFKVLPE